MRAFVLAALLLLTLVLPVAAAETWSPRAGGLTMGMRSGVTGVMFGDENGVGVRYWSNATAGGETAMVLTVCYASGSGAVVYCERHHLSA